jgi:hypothetical protein
VKAALCLALLGLFLGFRAEATGEDAPVVTTEDVAIADQSLVRTLAPLLKKEGLLTSTRQVNSYMIAVLCEYSQSPATSKPTCSFRRLKRAH